MRNQVLFNFVTFSRKPTFKPDQNTQGLALGVVFFTQIPPLHLPELSQIPSSSNIGYTNSLT